MRKIAAFIPAGVFAVLFGILCIAFREFNMSLFLIVCAFVLSGIFSCADRYILSLFFAALPVCGFIAMSIDAGGGGNAKIGYMTASAIVLFSFVIMYLFLSIIMK